MPDILCNPMHVDGVSVASPIPEFIHNLRWYDIPSNVQHMAARCLLDLSATLVAGNATALSRIARNVATIVYGGDDATLLLDGRRVSAPGAALANGMTIDAMDMHDGYRPAKGHAGVGVFPAALAAAEMVGWTGAQFMTALVIGYEIALRAAVALHQTACDYHTSGAWGTLGATAMVARALALDTAQTRHALGIAEYHGPRSQMMRCIDHPTMLKDGSGWGSMAGVLAALLAEQGFTGAPALTVEDSALAPLWDDLGVEWRMLDLYFKPYACCRWAQPAVEAVLNLVRRYQLAAGDIAQLEVHTFAAATRLDTARPATTEAAQYSLPYPVAATLLDERLDPAQVMPPRIFDEPTLQLAECVTMVVDDSLEARFPVEALARVILRTEDGRTLASDVCGARGDPTDPLPDVELIDKYTRLTKFALSPARQHALHQACWEMAGQASVDEFVALLGDPPDANTDGR